MDEIDRKLLAALQDDARVTRSELGTRVGLSASAVADRLRRLEDDGVVLGYRAELDRRALGYDLTAIVRIRPDSGQMKSVSAAATSIPEVIECHRVTGEDCYVLTVVLRSIDELEDLVDRFTPFGRTTTSIVNSTPVPRRGFPL
ncbi:MAG TPA: Lrp/AsnC family transcriptional regulator [Actinomycetota bacterium]|nr:Lrp/AsnC family transcriptional regulator [Actinomycetota bacterium]